MKALVFKRGGIWEDVDEGWPLGDIPDNADIDEFLQSKGFTENCPYDGRTYSFQVWSCQDQPFVIFWSPNGDETRTLYAPAVPDLIELLALLAPTATLRILGDFATQMEKLDVVLESHPDYRADRRRIQQLRAKQPKRS